MAEDNVEREITPSTPAEDPSPTTMDALYSEGQSRPWGEPPSPAPSRIGQYLILRQLGEGGMGVVYEAQQENPRRRVAVKVVHGGLAVDEATVRSFQREADTLARLKHPNIATIYESGCTSDGRHFFAMELVQGETLAAFLARRGPAATGGEVRFRLSLFRSIAEAVHYAHQRGVIHRDLKPSNILVTEAGVAGAEDSVPAPAAPGSPLPAIKILDFGVARLIEGDAALRSTTTEVGQIKGTLAYMSPEQARGEAEEIDIRTDVYALGVILYEMLAGARPYRLAKAAIAEAIRVICEEPPLPLSQSMRGLSRLDHDIETIVNKALEKERDLRYASAAALAEDVSRYLMSQPILARAPSAAYQLRKFAVRNRTLVGGILATLIVLIAGAAVATAFGFREAAQRRAAEQARNDLEAVVEFQSGMLNDMDPEAVGRRLLADLKQRVGETGRSRGWPEGRIRAVETGFTEAVASINSTSLALRLIDEEILGRAARTAGERFQDRPRIYARLRDAIGETYGSLGMFRQAEEQLEEALNVRRRTSGDGSPETLLSMKHLSFLYLKQGRFDQARTAAEPGLVLHRRVLGEGHRESLAMAHNLALIYASLDRYAEAEPLSGETLARQRQVLGERHPDTLNSMDLLAVLSRDQGRLDAAEQQLKAALEARKSAQGVEHESTLQTLNNLAALYAMRGRVAEAAQLFQESLAVMKRKLGQEHPSTLAMMHNLAVSYSKLRRYSEAEALQLETLAHRRRVLGAEHPATLTTMNNLAIVYYDSGRRAEAERLDREILGMRRRTLGEDHTDTLVSMNNLAVLLRDAGRYGEAEPLFRDALERRRRVSGLAHPSTEQVRTNLIAMYRAQGRAADAAALMAEKLEAARMNAGREDAVSEVLNDAAWQLLTAEPAHLRDQAKALEFARRACAKEEAQRGPNLWNYLDTLALALQRNGDTAAAVEAEKRAIASLPPDRPERAGLVRQLAEFEARLAGGKSKGRNLPLQGGPPRK